MHPSIFHRSFLYHSIIGVAAAIASFISQFLEAISFHVSVGRRDPPTQMRPRHLNMRRPRVMHGARRGGVPPHASKSGLGRFAESC